MLLLQVAQPSWLTHDSCSSPVGTVWGAAEEV